MILRLDVAAGLLAKKLDLAIETVVQKLAVDIHKGVTERTPVDTGRARASWQLGLGKMNDAVADEVPEGQTLPPPAPLDVSAINGKQVVYITNNLPYAEPLENGHSQQAPAGMVAVTLIEVEMEAENVINQL